jgi:2-polyprenyl-3-methyl-5-hydroxy-6-metoxy-1,4-benzoquinol methylase
MITREDVIYAYRLLFGREPENEIVINHYATEVSSIHALRELFMNSMEFQSSLTKVLAARPPKIPFAGPPMYVELDAPSEKLSILFSKISKQWQHLGETEPHWSVLTNDSYFRKTFEMNRTTFYATGETEATVLDSALIRAGISKIELKRCVELGCGVGRVTASLATRFQEVVGVDISTAHLRVAQEYFSSKDIDNIQCKHLHAIDDIASLGCFDILYSRIVLQHNPPPVMQRLLNDLLAQLNPGGIALIQIPTYKAGYRFVLDEYLAIENKTEMEVHFFPQFALFDLIKKQNCTILEIREDDAIGIEITSISNTLIVQKNS